MSSIFVLLLLYNMYKTDIFFIYSHPLSHITTNKNDIIITKRNISIAWKIQRLVKLSLQDPFVTGCARRVTNVASKSVPYGRPCDSKSFVTILSSGRWYNKSGWSLWYTRHNCATPSSLKWILCRKITKKLAVY